MHAARFIGCQLEIDDKARIVGKSADAMFGKHMKEADDMRWEVAAGDARGQGSQGFGPVPSRMRQRVCVPNLDCEVVDLGNIVNRRVFAEFSQRWPGKFCNGLRQALAGDCVASRCRQASAKGTGITAAGRLGAHEKLRLAAVDSRASWLAMARRPTLVRSAEIRQIERLLWGFIASCPDTARMRSIGCQRYVTIRPRPRRDPIADATLGLDVAIASVCASCERGKSPRLSATEPCAWHFGVAG